jgi:hypothetical protein
MCRPKRHDLRDFACFQCGQMLNPLLQRLILLERVVMAVVGALLHTTEAVALQLSPHITRDPDASGPNFPSDTRSGV